MRILIVSGYFPPYAPMSGVRAGKLAKYLLAEGHDVRVLAAKGLPFPPLLRLEIPERLVTYSKWLDINGLPKRIAALRGPKTPTGAGGKSEAADPVASESAAAPDSALRRLLHAIRVLYTDITNWPDPQIGWMPYAVADGTRLLRDWRADLIYATVPPLTGLLVARRLARRFRIPWIAEFRDLWIDHPYYEAPAWRHRLEKLQQDRTVGEAAALVTVSDAWRDVLKNRFGKPVATILNGFDPDDYPPEPPATSATSNQLTISYTGTLYPGRRDPTPVFRAIRLLGERSRDIRVQFFGADRAVVQELADKAGVADQVDVSDPVGYERVIRIQREADILLLLRWNDPSEHGVVPGKLFEYIGARRPVLSLGFEQGAVPDIIRSRRIGLVSEDPAVIAQALERWLDEKKASGRIEPLPLECREGLSRSDQFKRLERFIEDILQLPHCKSG